MKIKKAKVQSKKSEIPYLAVAPVAMGGSTIEENPLRIDLFEKTKPIYSLCVLRDAYCERNLKKQSQFENAQMNVSLIITRDYGKSKDWTFGQNKPKQSQFFTAENAYRPSKGRRD